MEAPLETRDSFLVGHLENISSSSDGWSLWADLVVTHERPISGPYGIESLQGQTIGVFVPPPLVSAITRLLQNTTEFKGEVAITSKAGKLIRCTLVTCVS